VRNVPSRGRDPGLVSGGRGQVPGFLPTRHKGRGPRWPGGGEGPTAPSRQSALGEHALGVGTTSPPRDGAFFPRGPPGGGAPGSPRTPGGEPAFPEAGSARKFAARGAPSVSPAGAREGSPAGPFVREWGRGATGPGFRKQPAPRSPWAGSRARLGWFGAWGSSPGFRGRGGEGGPSPPAPNRAVPTPGHGWTGGPGGLRAEVSVRPGQGPGTFGEGPSVGLARLNWALAQFVHEGAGRTEGGQLEAREFRRKTFPF